MQRLSGRAAQFLGGDKAGGLQQDSHAAAREVNRGAEGRPRRRCARDAASLSEGRRRVRARSGPLAGMAGILVRHKEGSAW
jgi:hypothetical protein